jgi:hypothetical protein
MAELFVAALTGSADTPLWFEAKADAKAAGAEWQAIKAAASAAGRRCPRHPLGWLSQRQLYGPVAACWARLAAMNCRGDGWAAGIFFRVADFDPAAPRKKDQVRGFSRLSAEWDAPQLAARAMRDVLRELDAAGAPPTALVESSPGKFQAIWALNRQHPPELLAPTLQRLAARLGADPAACLSTQLLRVPGFLHRKREPVLCRLVHPSPTAQGRFLYTLQELQARLGLAAASIPSRRKRCCGSGHGAHDRLNSEYELPPPRPQLDELRSLLAVLPKDARSTVQLAHGPVAVGLGGRAGFLTVALALSDAAARWPDIEDELREIAVHELAQLGADSPAQAAAWAEGNAALWDDLKKRAGTVDRTRSYGTLVAAARALGWAGRDGGAGWAAFVEKIRPRLGRLRGEAALGAACFALLRHCTPEEARAAAVPTALALRRRRVPATDLLRVLGPFGVESHHLQHHLREIAR